MSHPSSDVIFITHVTIRPNGDLLKGYLFLAVLFSGSYRGNGDVGLKQPMNLHDDLTLRGRRPL